MTTYRSGRALAIVCGVTATGGALAILLADPIQTGNWRLDHVLLPLIVAITIAAGHLSGSALRGWRILPALGFVLIFAIGTVLTVYSSVGAQKSGAGARQEAAVALHNEALAAKSAELVRARARLEQANAMADREMTGESCGRRCNDWKTRAKEVAAHISQIEGEIRGLGAPQIAPSKARPFAEAMGVLGLNAAQIEKAAVVFEPFAFSLLFELTAIVAFSYGFGGQRQSRAVAPVYMPESLPSVRIEPPRGGGGVKVMNRDDALADLKALLKAGQEPESQDWLAERWGVQKGTASKWLSRWETEGELPGNRRTEGRRKTVVA